MHIQAAHFLQFVKRILPDYFKSKMVLDVGSGDINGNNRYLFENCIYKGNDVIPFNNLFDMIISSEAFEHDPEYKESFLKIYSMLKNGGLFAFTCASTNRPEHGTRRTSPKDSYGTIGGLEDMSDYYKNLTIMELNEVLPLNENFSEWKSYYNSQSCDLYFYGIKRLHLEEYK